MAVCIVDAAAMTGWYETILVAGLECSPLILFPSSSASWLELERYRDEGLGLHLTLVKSSWAIQVGKQASVVTTI